MALITQSEFTTAYPQHATNGDLTAILAAAEAVVKQFTQRNYLESGSVTEVLDGNLRQYLVLGEFPVTSVTSVTVDGTALTATEYELHTGGRLWNASRCWPDTEPNNISVVYVAGYATVPDDIKRATMMIADNLIVRSSVLDGSADSPVGILRKEQFRDLTFEYAGTELARQLSADLLDAVPAAAKALLYHHAKPRVW